MRSRRSGTHPTASVRLSPQGGGTSVPPGPWWPAAKCGAGPCWHGMQEGPRRAERLPRTCRWSRRSGCAVGPVSRLSATLPGLSGWPGC